MTDSASNMVKAFNLFPGTEEGVDDVTAGASCATEHEEEEGLPELSQVKKK